MRFEICKHWCDRTEFLPAQWQDSDGAVGEMRKKREQDESETLAKEDVELEDGIGMLAGLAQ